MYINKSTHHHLLRYVRAIIFWYATYRNFRRVNIALQTPIPLFRNSHHDSQNPQPRFPQTPVPIFWDSDIHFLKNIAYISPLREPAFQLRYTTARENVIVEWQTRSNWASRNKAQPCALAFCRGWAHVKYIRVAKTVGNFEETTCNPSGRDESVVWFTSFDRLLEGSVCFEYVSVQPANICSWSLPLFPIFVWYTIITRFDTFLEGSGWVFPDELHKFFEYVSVPSANPCFCSLRKMMLFSPIVWCTTISFKSCRNICSSQKEV